MNIKEIGEIRRHIRRDRSNITHLYGCYVNENKEIISECKLSTGMMSENEGEKYFGLLKRTLSGSIGKNLIDINFTTAQVAGSEEHKLLMDLRQTGLADSTLREAFYKKVMETVSIGSNYLILLGCDRYDVPFKSKEDAIDSDRSDEVYTFLLCAICPVKQTKPNLHYIPEEKSFHDGGITNVVSFPELGFLFPAFDSRSTNIYNALYYTHSPKESFDAFVDAVFHTQIPAPAAQQKKSFEALLSRTLEEECSLDVVQNVHNQLCQCVTLHKESRVPDTLLVDKNTVQNILSSCGISEPTMEKFSREYDEAFGADSMLHPKNIIDTNRFEIKTADISIKVAPDKADLIETRTIGGVKYLLIPAEEGVEVNGVCIHIQDKEPLGV